MITYLKPIGDLAIGDIVAMYGSRERVESIEYANERGTMAHLASLTSPGFAHDVFFDAYRKNVRVELPAGHKLVAVPIEDNA